MDKLLIGIHGGGLLSEKNYRLKICPFYLGLHFKVFLRGRLGLNFPTILGLLDFEYSDCGKYTFKNIGMNILFF
jgi:hypothetical protein